MHISAKKNDSENQDSCHCLYVLRCTTSYCSYQFLGATIISLSEISFDQLRQNDRSELVVPAYEKKFIRLIRTVFIVFIKSRAVGK